MCRHDNSISEAVSMLRVPLSFLASGARTEGALKEPVYALCLPPGSLGGCQFVHTPCLKLVINVFQPVDPDLMRAQLVLQGKSFCRSPV